MIERARASGVARDDRVVGVEHERALRVDQLREPALRRDGSRRASRGGRGGRRSRSCRPRPSSRATASAAAARRARSRRGASGRQLGQTLDERHPDVAAEDDRVGRVAARTAAVSDDVVVLPFVPVTPMVGAGQSRRKRSGSETSAGDGSSPAARAVDERLERRAEARLGRREVRVDRRRRRHERGAVPGRGRIDVRARRAIGPRGPRAGRSRRPAPPPAGRRRRSPGRRRPRGTGPGRCRSGRSRAPSPAGRGGRRRGRRPVVSASRSSGRVVGRHRRAHASFRSRRGRG